MSTAEDSSASRMKSLQHGLRMLLGDAEQGAGGGALPFIGIADRRAAW